MQHIKLAPNWLRFLIVVVLVVGIFFRFFNLDGKVYSYDETYTSLRISGYTATEVRRQIFNSRIVKKDVFAQYQSVNPEKSLGDTLKSLATEDPQRPPLYYLIARLWVQIFGTSVTAIRSLSTIISLLVFPCVYWLCQELFDVPLSVPYFAIALTAISPVHLIFAQEAQEYILWLVTILFSSATLLRAMRLDPTLQKEEDYTATWGIYAVALTISLYTSLLSGFVAVVHGIYVAASTEFHWSKTVKSYTIASLASFLAFIPWVLVILANLLQFHQTKAWSTIKLPLLILIQSWLIQFSRIFFDLDINFENSFSYLITSIFVLFFGYSIYILCRTTHPKVWLFIVTLIAVPALPFILPDLIFGGMRSNTEVYLIPSYLGMQLAGAYLLATQIYNGTIFRRKIWQIILLLVILSGLVSCAVSSQKETWWNKVVSNGNPKIANILNQTSRPLLISNLSGINYGNVFSLSYLVQPKVRFLLVKDTNIPKITTNFSDVFLLNPSSKLRKEIEKKYKSKTRIVYGDKYCLLWKLTKPLSGKKYT